MVTETCLAPTWINETYSETFDGFSYRKEESIRYAVTVPISTNVFELVVSNDKQ